LLLQQVNRNTNIFVKHSFKFFQLLQNIPVTKWVTVLKILSETVLKIHVFRKAKFKMKL